MTPLLLFSACLLGLHVSPPSFGHPNIAIEAHKIPADSLNGWRESSCSLQEQTLDLLYNQALRYLENNKLELAIAILETISGRDPGYRDVRARLGPAKKTLARKLLAKQAQTEYERAVTAFRIGDLPAAIVALERVREIKPGYKDSLPLLESAKRINQAAKSWLKL